MCRSLVCVLACWGWLCAPSTAAQDDMGNVSGAEFKLWQFADDESERLEASGLIVRDSALTAYVARVAASMAPPAEAFPRPLHYAILDDPEANAFAMPNGRIYLHLGLLTTLQSEDELAAVLAHESAHVVGRHGVEGYNQARGTSAALQILSAGVMTAFGVAGGTGAGLWNGLSQLGLGLAASAAVSGHGRGREAESDEVAVVALYARKRNACGARDAFASMLDLYDDPSAVATFFYGSHPRLQSRRDAAEQLAEETTGVPCEEAAVDSAYLARIAPLRAPVARAWTAAGRPDRAQRLAQTGLRADSLDAALHTALAEALAASGSIQAAEDHFTVAVGLEPGDAAAHRGLAQLLDGQGRQETAIASYQAYLATARRPRDRRYVLARIAELEAALSEGPAAPDSAASPGAHEQPGSPTSPPTHNRP